MRTDTETAPHRTPAEIRAELDAIAPLLNLGKPVEFAEPAARERWKSLSAAEAVTS